MTSQLILVWIMRFLHIASAMAAIGAPFFVRFALMPAAKSTLDDATHNNLREAIGKRWRHFIYIFILIFLVTGFYNFLVETRLPPTLEHPKGMLITSRWRDFSPQDKKTYHMLFGIKTLCAFGIFFLASALAGRAKVFALIRQNARLYTTLLLLLAGLVLTCSTLLRFLPLNPEPPAILQP